MAQNGKRPKKKYIDDELLAAFKRIMALMPIREPLLQIDGNGEAQNDDGYAHSRLRDGGVSRSKTGHR